MTADAAPTVARSIDLHLHSTASDGTNPPELVVAAALNAGLQALALTDHDTIEGIADAQRAADGAGIQLVPGVELSAYEANDEVRVYVVPPEGVPAKAPKKKSTPKKS